LDIVQDVVGLYLRKCWTFFKKPLALIPDIIGLFCSSPNLHFLAAAAVATALYSQTILEKSKRHFPSHQRFFPEILQKKFTKMKINR